MKGVDVLEYLKKLCRALDEGRPLELIQTVLKPLAIPAAVGLTIGAVSCLEPDDPDPCAEIAYYGPAPCASDDDCIADNGEGWYCDEEATVGEGECATTWPTCREADPDPCPEVAYYGPMPCGSDDDCVEEHGDGWYCDEENTFGEGECASTWPVCVRGDDPDPCPEVAYYGPMPCGSDDACVEEHGEGWYCDEENTFGEGECASTWPVCREAEPDPCPEVAYYGPMPCGSDDDCVAEHGEGWYCDEENSFGDGECAVNWAICRES